MPTPSEMGKVSRQLGERVNMMQDEIARKLSKSSTLPETDFHQREVTNAIINTFANWVYGKWRLTTLTEWRTATNELNHDLTFVYGDSLEEQSKRTLDITVSIRDRGDNGSEKDSKD